ncbi:hypothetical protein M2158_003707 [Streptomyces sp. SAI-144]|uniref:hypothetical protein n=1 Tax=unclassified Streptomyces TaxID=2593676 RepID=UPI002473CC28|nr:MULTISPECIES: hypothetical protein [unclassified Streptomyces]MDH6435230.1 hypothetical protein [Streptomyces sp. SAI-144]MDH6489319.1 hypothetical protein [Streptomyces sp. SAI-127]
MTQGSIRMSVATTACAGAGCVRRESGGLARRRAAPGTRLCPACQEHLVRDLSRLPELYEECARHLAGGGGERSPEKTSGGPLPGMPFNCRAADTRSSILGVLSSWATLVLEEFGLTGPRRAVAPLTRFLVRHSNWLAGHEAAGDVSAEVAQLVRKAHGVIDPATSRRIPVGDCVEPDCSGDLTAIVRPRTPRLPATITCTENPAHHWAGPEWLQLSRRLGAAPADDGTAQEERWVTAADIARLWAVPPGSVYRHASTEKWRRRSASGRTYYHATDVHESLKHRSA